MASLHLHMWLSLLLLLFHFIFLLKKKLNSKHLPPSPPRLPIIGNLHQLGALPHYSLWQLSKKYGPVMLLQFGRVPTVIISSAEAAKELFKANDLNSCSRPRLAGTGRLSYSYLDIALIPYGDYWREMRNICVLQLFSAKRVQSFQSIREEEVRFLIDSILKSSSASSSPVHLSEKTLSLTANVTCRVAFGESFQERGLAHERFQENIFIAGVDTGAIVLVWAMAELVRNPRAMRKAQEEIRTLLGNKTKVSETDIDKLEYLKMVLKETMRLHPPGTLLIPRETMSQFSINGYEIHPKTRIQVNVWAIGRDPKTWKNPEEFFPERFIDNSIDFRGQNYELLPFGGGRRGCPGITMGLALVELALANLLFCFDWKVPNNMEAEINMEEIFWSYYS
ncbi:hypothetical protein JCGZ_11117 [Jatropha curcas]|uniref:Cytochrome P450 n=1 Tax=Jatropha curcas TaxID=180498 RepID=A0A067KEL5_JATCU|nr:hypothetical protein JCGZ_11117 [Jatropha curcas]